MVALRSDHVIPLPNEHGFPFSEQTKNGLPKLGLKLSFTTGILASFLCDLVPRVLLGTKVPWWIVVTWFRFIAQILGNKIFNFE